MHIFQTKKQQSNIKKNFFLFIHVQSDLQCFVVNPLHGMFDK